MASLNKCLIIGNLGGDPELRYLPNGDAVTNFSVAVNENWTTDGEKHDRTEWFNVVCWRKLAEVCAEHLSKGSSVYIEGRLQTRSWDGQDGKKNYRTEVVGEKVQFLDSKGRERAETPATEDLPW